VLLSGGAEGAQLADLLSSLGIKVVNVPVLGAVGANVSIVKPDGHRDQDQRARPGALG
jgi:1-phosphofructokinase